MVVCISTQTSVLHDLRYAASAQPLLLSSSFSSFFIQATLTRRMTQTKSRAKGDTSQPQFSPSPYDLSSHEACAFCRKSALTRILARSTWPFQDLGGVLLLWVSQTVSTSQFHAGVWSHLISPNVAVFDYLQPSVVALQFDSCFHWSSITRSSKFQGCWNRCFEGWIARSLTSNLMLNFSWILC